MALPPVTQKGIVKALNQSFDAAEVASILEALAVYTATSPSAKSATPNFDLYMSGRYYEPQFTSVLNASTYQGVANRIDLSPFFVTEDVSINEVALNTVIGVAATTARILIYDSTEAGWPDRKVVESAALSTATSTTVSTHAVDFKFKAGELYWLGVHCSGAPTLRGLRDYAVPSLGLLDATASAGTAKTVGRTVTYGSAPASWAFVEADLNGSATGPVVRFKVA